MTGLDSPQKSVEADKRSVNTGFHAYQLEFGSTTKPAKTEPSFLLLDSPFSQKSQPELERSTQLGRAATERPKPNSESAKPDSSPASLDSTKVPEKTSPSDSKITSGAEKAKTGSNNDLSEFGKSFSTLADSSKPMSQQELDSWFGTPKLKVPDANKRPSSDQPPQWRAPAADTNISPSTKNESATARDRSAQTKDLPATTSDKKEPRLPQNDHPKEVAPAREFNLRDRLQNPNIPDAKVYVPPGFDASKPVNLIIYNHGWRDTAGSAFRNANLKEQMAKAPANSMLVIPAWQASEGAESSVEDSRFTKNLMGMLQGSLRAQGTDLNNVGSISLVSHSAGGTPVERELNALRGTSLYDRISTVASLDTNYGVNQPAVDSWIAHNIQNGKFSRNQAAFLNLYASGTDSGSRAQAARVAKMINNPSINPQHDALLDRGSAVAHGGTVRAQDLSRLPIVFQNTGDAHGRFPNKFFGYAISKVGNRNL